MWHNIYFIEKANIMVFINEILFYVALILYNNQTESWVKVIYVNRENQIK